MAAALVAGAVAASCWARCRCERRSDRFAVVSLPGDQSRLGGRLLRQRQPHGDLLVICLPFLAALAAAAKGVQPPALFGVHRADRGRRIGRSWSGSCSTGRLRLTGLPSGPAGERADRPSVGKRAADAARSVLAAVAPCRRDRFHCQQRDRQRQLRSEAADIGPVARRNPGHDLRAR